MQLKSLLQPALGSQDHCLVETLVSGPPLSLLCTSRGFDKGGIVL